MRFCKRILEVNNAVLGELGAFPLSVESNTAMITTLQLGAILNIQVAFVKVKVTLQQVESNTAMITTLQLGAILNIQVAFVKVHVTLQQVESNTAMITK